MTIASRVNATALAAQATGDRGRSRVVQGTAGCSTSSGSAARSGSAIRAAGTIAGGAVGGVNWGRQRCPRRRRPRIATVAFAASGDTVASSGMEAADPDGELSSRARAAPSITASGGGVRGLASSDGGAGSGFAWETAAVGSVMAIDRGGVAAGRSICAGGVEGVGWTRLWGRERGAVSGAGGAGGAGRGTARGAAGRSSAEVVRPSMRAS